MRTDPDVDRSILIERRARRISARVAGRRGQDQVLAAEVLQLHDAFGREWMALRHSEKPMRRITVALPSKKVPGRSPEFGRSRIH
jgi:hypothetical protein